MELSDAAKQKIEEWTQYRDNEHILSRPSWDEVFMKRTYDIAKRSHDAQTQCGAVLVRNNAVVSDGYNGFPREIDDSILPNLRPEKYPFMIHAEVNAILNAVKLGRSTEGCTMYICGAPCLQCAMICYQAGIVEIVHGNHYFKMMDNDEWRVNFEIFKFLTQGKLSFRVVTFNGV